MSLFTGQALCKKTILLSAFVMFMTLVTHALGSESSLIYKEMLYCEKRQALYDQSAITSSAKFLHASREEQERMLEKYLHDVKFWGLVSLIGKAMGTMAFYGGIPATVIYKMLQGRDIGGAMGISMALQPLSSILAEFYKKVDAQGTFLANIFMEEVVARLRFAPQVPLPVERIELDYVRRKPFLDAKFVQLIEDSLLGFFCRAAWIEGAQRGGITSIEGIKMALALPTELKKLSYDETLIESTLSGYSDDIKEALKLFCVRHIASGQTAMPRKAPIYFYGPHGVGKTFAVKLIANALQLPCATIQLRGTLDSLIGDSDRPGQLLEAMTTAHYNGKGAKNMILFIDEADKIINFNPVGQAAPELQAIRSFLLHLFDAETKTFYSPYLKMDVDIAHVGIILAGNAPIEYAPMANRFRLVEFPKFTSEQKLHLLETALLDKALVPYEQQATSIFAINKDDLTAEDHKAFHEIIEHDADEGLRSLQAKLEDYLANMAACKATHKDNLSLVRKLYNAFSSAQREETEQRYRSCIRSLNKITPRNTVVSADATAHADAVQMPTVALDVALLESLFKLKNQTVAAA